MNPKTPPKEQKSKCQAKKKSPSTNKKYQRSQSLLAQTQTSLFEEESEKTCVEISEPCSHSFFHEYSAIKEVPKYTAQCINSRFGSPAVDLEAHCGEDQQIQNLLTDLGDKENPKNNKIILDDDYEETKGKTPGKADQSGEGLEEKIEAIVNKKFEVFQSFIVGHNQCLEKQNQLFERQNQLLERQNQLLERQNQLLERRQSQPQETALVEQIPFQREIEVDTENPEEVINPDTSSDTDSCGNESPKEAQADVTGKSLIYPTNSLLADKIQLPNVSFEGYSISKISRKIHLKISLRNNGTFPVKGNLELKYQEGVSLYNQKDSKRVQLIQPQQKIEVKLRLKRPPQEECGGFNIHSTIWRLVYTDEKGHSHYIGKLIRVELDLRNK